MGRNIKIIDLSAYKEATKDDSMLVDYWINLIGYSGTIQKWINESIEEAIKNYSILHYLTSVISKQFPLTLITEKITDTREAQQLGLLGVWTAVAPPGSRACRKCGSDSYQIAQVDWTEGFNPKKETYDCKLVAFEKIESIVYVPIDVQNDLWVCPNCKELHGFKFDQEKGLVFDQEVL